MLLSMVSRVLQLTLLYSTDLVYLLTYFDQKIQLYCHCTSTNPLKYKNVEWQWDAVTLSKFRDKREQAPNVS